ncbi:hypothetical protein [Streptomyces sp. NPDC002763]|uniref:hypothetical protein n=1 Tax=Streptomyces sp. NPDC002763 TaxID=3154427 RepID=UPI00331A5793
MDVRHLGTGARLFLPVQVPEARFHVGDRTSPRATAKSPSPPSRLPCAPPSASPSTRTRPPALWPPGCVHRSRKRRPSTSCWAATATSTRPCATPYATHSPCSQTGSASPAPSAWPTSARQPTSTSPRWPTCQGRPRPHLQGGPDVLNRCRPRADSGLTRANQPAGRAAREAGRTVVGQALAERAVVLDAGGLRGRYAWPRSRRWAHP